MVSAIYAADSLYAVYATSVDLIEDHDPGGSPLPGGSFRSRARGGGNLRRSGGLRLVPRATACSTTCAMTSRTPCTATIRCCSPTTGSSRPAGAITALRMSADGLLATVGQEELLYVPVVKLLAAPVFSHQGYTLQAGAGI